MVGWMESVARRRLAVDRIPGADQFATVYDISILSNIPSAVLDVIEPSASAQRLRPLFNIGVHDLSDLLDAPTRRGDSEEEDSINGLGSGWVACTTDTILAMKDGLWDMLIAMPPTHSANATERVWPTVECPKGVPVKATQRDLRRYRALKLGLARLASFSSSHNLRSPQSAETPEMPGPSAPGVRRPSSRPGTAGDDSMTLTPAALASHEDADKIVEPTTWAALAYSGFLWWASAGEQRRSDEAEESALDATLLTDLAPPALAMSARRASFGVLSGAAPGVADSVASLTAHPVDRTDAEEERARIELAIIAYFHRLTTAVLGALADVVDSSDEDDMLDVDVDAAAGATTDEDDDSDEAALLRRGDSADGRSWVRVDSDAIAHMGLDVWSKSDAEFVREVTDRYFGRRAYVEIKGVEVCGLRVC